MLAAVYAAGQVLGDTRTAFIGGGFWRDLAVIADVKGHPAKGRRWQPRSLAWRSFGEAAFRLLRVEPSAGESRPSRRPFAARMPSLLPIENERKVIESEWN